MTRTNERTGGDLGDDRVIHRVRRRDSGGGAWVSGRLAGHRFEALVFPAHADDPAWELGTSRIAKLWLLRLSDKRTVFSWDRGPDVEAADAEAAAVADFLAAGLADYVYTRWRPGAGAGRGEGQEAERVGRGGPGAGQGRRADELPGDDRGDGGPGVLDQPRRQDARRHAVRGDPARTTDQGGVRPVPQDRARQVRPRRDGATLPILSPTRPSSGGLFALAGALPSRANGRNVGRRGRTVGQPRGPSGPAPYPFTGRV
jgi:hypothetical protein